LRQLDLTFDPEFMPPGGLSAVLPAEFEGWKKSAAKTTFSLPGVGIDCCTIIIRSDKLYSNWEALGGPQQLRRLICTDGPCAARWLSSPLEIE
jgi:hypothetical protein